MDWIIESLPTWNSWMGVLLYSLPAVVCLWAYGLRAAKMYRADLAARDAAEEGKNCVRYSPSLTVGWLIGCALVSVVPAVNLLIAVFWGGPLLLSGVFSWLGKVFDIPLAPKR